MKAFLRKGSIQLLERHDQIDSFIEIGHFSKMLKSSFSMKETERAVADALKEVLRAIPFVHVTDLVLDAPVAGRRIDVLADVEIQSEPHKILIEVKQSGQPHSMRDAVAQLKAMADVFDAPTLLMVGATYIPEATRALCAKAGVGWIDLAGNTRIFGPGVYIDRESADKPKAVVREMKSPFAPKSARVLRRLLSESDRAWKVVDLAEAAQVSLGQVSNVRRALIDREWASAEPDGLRLTDRDGLLNGWRDSYAPPVGERRRYYTTLHGKRLESALKDALKSSHQKAPAAAMSFTAADWLAPYARTPMTYLVADAKAVPTLIEALQLQPAETGANVEILIPDEADLFEDLRQPASGIWTTSPLQTFLDLGVSGERGVEAADHLLTRRELW